MGTRVFAFQEQVLGVGARVWGLGSIGLVM